MYVCIKYHAYKHDNVLSSQKDSVRCCAGGGFGRFVLFCRWFSSTGTGIMYQMRITVDGNVKTAEYAY